MSPIESLEFRVELWDEQDSHVIEVVALANNAIVARGAYDAAIAMMRPGTNLVLRHRARVIMKAREP
jgi:hypothetical protein